MLPRIIGLALAVIGLCISLFHEKILKKLLKKEKITDPDVIRVKCVGLAFAVVGAAIAMLLG